MYIFINTVFAGLWFFLFFIFVIDRLIYPMSNLFTFLKLVVFKEVYSAVLGINYFK